MSASGSPDAGNVTAGDGPDERAAPRVVALAGADVRGVAAGCDTRVLGALGACSLASAARGAGVDSGAVSGRSPG
jgi:hypothetical protein